MEISVSVEILQGIRNRVLPMLQVVAAQYSDRVPAGYPVVVDAPDRGMVGIELDQNYSLYFATDGNQPYAEMFWRAPRSDTRSSASRQKYGGMPFSDRRLLRADMSDQELRNLIAELMGRWNFQPQVIHITDSD